MVQISAPVNKKGAVIGMICNRIKKERKRLKLTQPEFADIAGAKKRTIIEWEKGATSPNAVQLSALSAGGVDVQYILTGVHGYIPGPLSVLETARKQAYIDAVEKAAQSNISPTVGDLTPLSTELNVRVGAKKDNKNGMYPVREDTRDHGKHAAERLADYQPLRPDQLALLDNVEHCPKEVQDAIRQLALVSARADRDEKESGTD